MSPRSNGWPSLSQVRVGGGTPVAEHSSSSGLFTAMKSSSGELEPVIFGGSGEEITRTFWPYCSFTWKIALKIQIAVWLPSTVRLKVFVLLPAWLLATQLYRPASEGATSGSWSLVSCPSNSRLRCRDSGWPSFSQVRVGGGTPRASQDSVTKEPWTIVTGSTGAMWSTPGGTEDHTNTMWSHTSAYGFREEQKMVHCHAGTLDLNIVAELSQTSLTARHACVNSRVWQLHRRNPFSKGGGIISIS